VTKPEETTGVVSFASVAEQMLYEIGDPRAYALPDVICDFSEVAIAETGADRVTVSGAQGRAPSGKLKVCATYVDGFRAGYLFQFNGRDAGRKARAFADAGLKRAREKLRAMNAADFADTCIEVTGGRTGEGAYQEVLVKTAVRHDDAKAVGLFLKETMGAGLATPPGLHAFTGAGRPKPSPVVRLFSFLADADAPEVAVAVEGADIGYQNPTAPAPEPGPPAHPAPEVDGDDLIEVPLEAIAWARSGDKGDKANIGVIARDPAFLSFIWTSLDEDAIRTALRGFAKGAIEKFHLPGTQSMNILAHEALGGGGVASLLNDAQGKGYAQMLLAAPIRVPRAIAPEGEVA
ncbi:MAG: acyclic terpene utilization AtuA family protein, partial [Pseudomonadota bacterium]